MQMEIVLSSEFLKRDIMEEEKERYMLYFFIFMIARKKNKPRCPRPERKKYYMFSFMCGFYYILYVRIYVRMSMHRSQETRQ